MVSKTGWPPFFGDFDSMTSKEFVFDSAIRDSDIDSARSGSGLVGSMNYYGILEICMISSVYAYSISSDAI